MGYESELEAGDRRDVTDWLVIQGVVTDSGGSRVYDGISLDVEDALLLSRWLRAAAGDASMTEHVDPIALLEFMEPDLAIELLTRDESAAATRWYFYDPNAQVLTRGRATLNARSVDIDCTRARLLSSAESWARELADFLNR